MATISGHASVYVPAAGGSLLSSRFTRAASQSLNNLTWTAILWDTIDWDDLGIAPVAGLVTFLAPGTYTIQAFATIDGIPQVGWDVTIQLHPMNSDSNDTGQPEFANGVTGSGATIGVNTTGTHRFRAADSLNVLAIQNSGAVGSVDAASVVITKISDKTY